MSSLAFEVFDHTADIGIIAYGSDLPELFANAARGMFSLLLDLDTVVPREERVVEVEGIDLEGLLVSWLNELLYLYTAEGLALSRFDILELSNSRLRARVRGERADPSRHHPHLDIKAATYHQLEIKGNDTWRARIIFDI
ncbi:MAG: archease [Armatimonadota bacterium]|nr:archease [Armatimonadota bacterium]MDR5703582.1 archease [Armatimonadota bacterium]MDR7433880.1 archease [Armatimonadota bacterium]